MDEVETCSTLFSLAAKAPELHERSSVVREPSPHSHQIFGDFVADELRRLPPYIADELRRNILKLIVEALNRQ